MHTHLPWYGLTVGGLLAVKLLLSIKRQGRPADWRTGPNYRIAAIITVYNEPADMLTRCLNSLLHQTRRPDTVTVVDDCSRTDDATRVLHQLEPAFAAAGIRLELIRFPVNRGKRHGLAAGFTAQPDADLYLCVDSDTVLDEHALAEAVRPFSRRRVMCVTGLVLAHNRAVNLLTRLIDMRYMNAFLGERVAYSRLGSVLCACGSLAVYRGWVVRRHLDDFLDQRFLGKPATFGDDRRLTYYCLLEGLSLIQPSAVGRTDVPERIGHYARQQIRWGKSFFREGVLLFAQFKILRTFWWLNLLELVTWLGFTVGLIAALVAVALHPAGWTILASYVGYVCAMAWLRSVHYLRAAGQVPLLDRIGTFAAAPLYALLNLVMLLPLRLWSLATLHRNGWGTRQQIEIVRDTPDLGLEATQPLAVVIPAPRGRHAHGTPPVAKLLDPDSERTLQIAVQHRW